MLLARRMRKEFWPCLTFSTGKRSTSTDLFHFQLVAALESAGLFFPKVRHQSRSVILVPMPSKLGSAPHPFLWHLSFRQGWHLYLQFIGKIWQNQAQVNKHCKKQLNAECKGRTRKRHSLGQNSRYTSAHVDTLRKWHLGFSREFGEETVFRLRACCVPLPQDFP